MRKLFLTLLFFSFFGGVLAVEAKAARLYLTPADGTYSIGDEFDLELGIDTGGEESMAADALLNFDSTKLEVVSVVKGSFFPGSDYNIDNDNGRLTIYSFSEQALQTNSGTGVLANITFKALTEGSAAVSFLCETGNDVDSAVWDAQGNDLINCGSNGSGTYTIGSGGGGVEPTDVPVATSAPDAPVATSAPDAPTSTPSQLPETGVETPLLVIGLGGVIMLLFSSLVAI